MSETAPPEIPWQRLDPRMLLVHPIREVLKFLPALAGLFIAGAASGALDLRWQLLGVLVPIGLGFARYLTTSYRVSGDRVELRRGLLDRHLLSTRTDRVRTVDLTSSLIHRALGLTTVRIGTGTASTSEEDQIDLDGLPVERARALRLDLLRVAPAADGSESGPEGPDPAVPASPSPPLLVLDPTWARYAPVTMTGVVLTGAVVGVGSQGLELVGGLGDGDALEAAVRGIGLVLVPIAAVGIATVVAVVSIAGYLVTNWGFTLTHDRRAWHLRRGLFTTRETSLDDERVAGVSVGEPVGLRLVGAARLRAIVTGLASGQESSVLVPPAPRSVVAHVAAAVVGTPTPLTGPLRDHGPAAVRRRWTRALVPALAVSAVLLAVVLGLDGWTWLVAPALAAPVIGAALAHDRARGLGHALVDGHLVARSGSLLRQRQVLDVDDVIGWTFRATWFQRRAGLTTLVATTAGGPQAVAVLDAPVVVAVDLADRALPGLAGQFLEVQARRADRSGPGGVARRDRPSV